MQNQIIEQETKNNTSRLSKYFWKKIERIARTSRRIIVKALSFYYASQREDCPKWARFFMVSALAYFILPVDAVPDFIPGAGFVDDFALFLISALIVAAHIREEDVARANEQADRLFGRLAR